MNAEVKVFGWQGIKLQVPEEWELAAEKGGFTKGYIRLDDVTAPKLSMSWDTVKEDKAKTPREALKELKKEIKKRDKSVKFLREDAIKVCGHPSRYFHWKSLTEGYELFWYCPDSKRAFASEFTFKPDEYWNLKPALDKVIESIQCHSTDDTRVWTTLDLKLEVPIEFNLVERSFYATRIHMLFSTREAYFIFDRVGFAQTILTETYSDLQDWLEKVYEPELKRRFKGIKFGRIRSDKVFDHEGLTVHSSYKSGTLFGKKHDVESQVWFCQQVNKIFAVTTVKEIGKNGKLNKGLKLILSSVKCHG